MRVLLTGAFGTIGTAALRELLHAGHQVRCLDLPSQAVKKAAREFEGRVEFVWGDICEPQAVARAVAGMGVVIHNAAIIPPLSEREPELARRINVGGTNNLVVACEAQDPKPMLVFASSVSLFGIAQDQPPPRHVGEPVRPSDHYTHSKAECEQILQASGLQWAILRFAAIGPTKVDLRSKYDRLAFFRLSPEVRIEVLHPNDAGLAEANAVCSEEVWGKILLVGGGARCQVRMRDFNRAFHEALGIGSLPDQAFGKEPYYTDWMDTDESQRILRYQRCSYDDWARELSRSARGLRILVRPLRPLLRRLMLRQSPFYGHGPVTLDT